MSNHILRLMLTVLLSATVLSAQSIADAARAAKAKKAAESSTAPTSTTPAAEQKKPQVFTNDNIGSGASTSASADKNGNRSATSGGDDSDDEYSAASNSAGKLTKRSADQWKAMIGRQKDMIANMEKQIAETRKSIQFVQSDLYTNGPEYNAAQKSKLDRMEQAEKRLVQEKQKLDTMRDTARKQGYGSAVTD